MQKLSLCIARAINMYYINYMHKKPWMVSYNISMCWLNLRNDLEIQYGFKP
jgi:hypothetical protein